MGTRIRKVAITNISPHSENYAGKCTSHKRKAEVEKGTSITTVATENGQYISPGVNIIVGYTTLTSCRS